ncbi:hypothetical protein BB560_006153 [Smittium megazygosporum]|uniref:Uncharacterized protein n=1 Tax=Smittium megazygosporum TaxID=133381 RepID=A0A2T9YFB3_9FUNG|nr:hypothetical protein BB560_006153 [Smittium megazygosporum]
MFPNPTNYINNGGYDQGYNHYNNNNGGYDNGYSQNSYNNSGGYGNGYSQNNGYDSGYGQNNYNNNAGYEGGYTNSCDNGQGEGTRGGNFGPGTDFSNMDFDIDENMSIEQMISQIAGSDIGIQNINLSEKTGSRDIAGAGDGFDISQLERNYQKLQNGNFDDEGDNDQRSGERGLFSSNNSGGGGPKLSHQIIAGSAAWLAMKWYQDNQKKKGKHVSHAGMKKFLASFAASQAVRMYDKKKCSSYGMSRETVANEAARSAVMGFESSAGGPGPSVYKCNDNPGNGEAVSNKATRSAVMGFESSAGGTGPPVYKSNDNPEIGEAASFDNFESSSKQTTQISYNNNGSNRGGYEQVGFTQGYNQRGYVQNGYHQAEYNQGGYYQSGYNQGGGYY